MDDKKLTNEELENLLKLEERASQNETGNRCVECEFNHKDYRHRYGCSVPEDAVIAAARNNIRALVQEVQRLRGDADLLETYGTENEALRRIVKKQMDELAALRRFRDGARAVIEFYANKSNWRGDAKYNDQIAIIDVGEYHGGHNARHFMQSEAWKGSE